MSMPSYPFCFTRLATAVSSAWRVLALLSIVCSATPLLHMTVGTTRTFCAFAAAKSAGHGAWLIFPLSMIAPVLLTVYTKGLISVSSLRCGMTSAELVAAVQYGSHPETSNDAAFVAAEAKNGTENGSKNKAAASANARG